MSLQELSDQAELLRLVTAYAYAIDERDFAALDRVFTPDARIDYTAMGGIAGDTATIKGWLATALAYFPDYMHCIGNTWFEVQGDTATGKVACFNPMVVPLPQGGSEVMLLGLWYLDRYQRTPQGWRITERCERKSYAHNVPAHLQALLNTPQQPSPTP